MESGKVLAFIAMPSPILKGLKLVRVGSAGVIQH